MFSLKLLEDKTPRSDYKTWCRYLSCRNNKMLVRGTGHRDYVFLGVLGESVIKLGKIPFGASNG